MGIAGCNWRVPRRGQASNFLGRACCLMRWGQAANLVGRACSLLRRGQVSNLPPQPPARPTPIPPPHSLPRSPLCHATQCLLLDAQVVELNTQCVHQPRSLGYILFGCHCSASGARCRGSHRRWLRNSETHLWGLMNDCCLGFGRYLCSDVLHVALPQGTCLGPGPTLLWDLKYPLSALRENMFGFWSVLWLRTLNICCSPRGTHAASFVRGEGQMFGAWPALWFRTPNIYCSPWVPIIFKTNSARVAKSTKIKEDGSLWRKPCRCVTFWEQLKFRGNPLPFVLHLLGCLVCTQA